SLNELAATLTVPLSLHDALPISDFWPDAIRKPLQDLYGAGGPGFLYAGLNAYRHANVKFERVGQWRVEPRQPSLWMRQNDGVFRSEEHTSELQSLTNLVCPLLLQ